MRGKVKLTLFFPSVHIYFLLIRFFLTEKVTPCDKNANSKKGNTIKISSPLTVLVGM